MAVYASGAYFPVPNETADWASQAGADTVSSPTAEAAGQAFQSLAHLSSLTRFAQGAEIDHSQQILAERFHDAFREVEALAEEDEMSAALLATINEVREGVIQEMDGQQPSGTFAQEYFGAASGGAPCKAFLMLALALEAAISPAVAEATADRLLALNLAAS